MCASYIPQASVFQFNIYFVIWTPGKDGSLVTQDSSTHASLESYMSFDNGLAPQLALALPFLMDVVELTMNLNIRGIYVKVLQKYNECLENSVSRKTDDLERAWSRFGIKRDIKVSQFLLLTYTDFVCTEIFSAEHFFHDIIYIKHCCTRDQSGVAIWCHYLRSLLLLWFI